MLRDELLRSKNDEIANCVLSRKRKLTELYYATVGFEAATADSLYSQKEKAFLDTNDIEQGRYFNEATLPSPTHARPRPSPSKPVASAATSSEKPHPVTGKPSLPKLDGDVASIATGASVESSTIKPGVATPTVASVPASSDQPSLVESSPKAAELVPVASSQVADPSASVPETPISAKGHDGGELKFSSSAANPAASNATPSLEIPSASLPRRKSENRPSLTIGSSNAEQPLSPASSIDPYSNNTPVPVTASPVTSPGDEATEVAKSGRLSPNHDRSMHSRSGLVPSTPDEQLRLEEAQSMQQAQADEAGGPTSNEVIQENINKDEMEVDEVPVAGSAEPQNPDGTMMDGEDDSSPTEKLPESTQPTTESVETPNRKSVTIPPTQPGSSQPERMTTRVSSGAIRHKSVSEILGETPKTPHSPTDQESSDSVARMRFKDRKDREKERTRLSTVVFPKQSALQQDKADSNDLVHRDSSDAVATVNEEQDYLFTLFLNRAFAPPRGMNLSTLLTSAHKTLSTGNHLLEYQESMDCRTLRRIYALQNANRWPLRQMKRAPEPARQGTHWDIMLDHMKWMRTDFREERKWKIAAAKSCADWCAEYVNSDEKHRALLRVTVKAPQTQTPVAQDTSKMGMASPSEDTADDSFPVSHPTPDLVPSAEEESVSDGYHDEPRHDIMHDTVAPAAIFSLGSDEFNFSVDMTPATEKLLDELPMYEPVRLSQETKQPIFKQLPDSVWKTDLLPVSKFASTKITFQKDEPERKRSRYDYSQYGSDIEHGLADIPPEQTNVALFRPENKPIRDRIHPGHSFRPPTEHPMPSVGFFESRQSSQWTLAEDDELRRLVKEYSYNWSLISSCLTSPSIFTSGAERRTPWECFERWVGLEGLPADMSKTQYFRAYHQRLETAQRTVLAQQQAAQQQQQQQQANSGQPQQPIRRRTTQPLRVDRRRSSRHLALLDAMRKLAKKRETMLQKQQHASHLASLRKANEANQPKPPITTPAEFSRLKYDREMKLAERQEQYRQQMIAQQRASFAAQRVGQVQNQPQSQNPQNPQNPQQPTQQLQQSQQPQQPMLNGQARPNNMTPNSGNATLANGTPNGVSSGIPQGSAGVNQARTQPAQTMGAVQIPVNGQMQSNAMPLKMMPQGQMQQPVGARPGMQIQSSPDNTRVMREANRLQEQQRMLQSRQQVPPQGQQPQQQFQNQQFGAQGSHSPNMNMANVNGPNNPAMMAALQAQGGGMQSPSFQGNTPQGVSTPSPRMGQPNPLSSGMVPTISSLQSAIQRSNPNLPADQVNKIATDRLMAHQQQRMSQQAAINAAAGGMNNAQANYQVPHDGNFQSPQQANGTSAMQVPQNQGFSPMMRVPQNNQQNRVAPTSSPAMNGVGPQNSRSATPQMQRSGSSQAGAPGSNKSPHPPAAQTATS